MTDRSWGGTLTSERTGLASSDADPRWIGVRRHQAVLVLVGLALIGDGVMRARSPLVEIVSGTALAVAALPVAGTDAMTVAELAAIAVRYCLRSRWSQVAVIDLASQVRVEARGRAAVSTYRLNHVGRLDLAGRDVDGAESVAQFADAMAAAGEDGHLSWHVRTDARGAATMLSITGGAVPPAGWTRDREIAEQIVDTPGQPAWIYERWGYVRCPSGTRAVLRVRDFSAAPAERAALAHVQLKSEQICVAVHADVLSSTRGRRLAERAVHRHRSDGAASAAAGFRRTAVVERSFARLREREFQVAAGRALLRLGVFVTVRAESLPELLAELRHVRSALHESGLRSERGRGRQADWYCRQLPGGPGW
jgi:hypothetical protein